MGCIVFSIKTAKQREAERFALGLYEDLYIHVKQGGSVNSKTFRQVFSEWAEATEKMAPTRQGGQNPTDPELDFRLGHNWRCSFVSPYLSTILVRNRVADVQSPASRSSTVWT